MKKCNNNSGVIQARKELGLKWGEMSDAEKKPYFDMQVEQKEAYMEWKENRKMKMEVKKVSVSI